MKRIFILSVISVIILLSVFSVFSKPNPNASSSSFHQPQLESDGFGKSSVATPEMVKTRLKSISASFELRYDDAVQSNIDKYLKYGRKQLTEIIERSSYYFPIFESALNSAGLPEEFKYIPVIESNLRTDVTSVRGAGGLWQFMPIAARAYDMKISAGIDERCDPYLSSEKACLILKDLYNKFGDWTLALAAYNAGHGTVQRALRRAGVKEGKADFWTIYNYLPAQTRNYLPKLIAMIYLMKYHSDHYIAGNTSSKSVTTDTVRVSEKVNLAKVAGDLNLDLKELKALNPHLRAAYTTGSKERPCNLILPVEKVKLYKEKQSSVLASI